VKRKGLLGKAKRVARQMGKDLNKSPLGRAVKGKRTRGFL